MPFNLNGTVIDDFTYGYLMKALTTGTNAAGTALNKLYSLTQLDSAALTTAISDCTSFETANAALLNVNLVPPEYPMRRSGEAFYMARNGKENWARGNNSTALHLAARKMGALTLFFNTGTSTLQWQ